VEEVHERAAQRSRGRYPDPPAGPRPDRRYARALDLDRRRHLRARAVEAGERQRDHAVRPASGERCC